MPSVDKAHRKSRVAESESEEDDNVGANANDAVLAKVDPEFLNKPVDLKQGDTKLKGLLLGLRMAGDELGRVAKALHDVALETAMQLSEAYPNDYDEDKMMQVFREEVRPVFPFS